MIGIMRFGEVIRRYELFKRARTIGRIEASLGACGGNLVCDDPNTLTLIAPDQLSVGANVGFNVYVYVNAMGGVQIGDDTRFGPFTMIHSADHRFDDLQLPIWKQGHLKEPIRIGKDVWVGGHAVILRGALIPDHCVIGAGSRIDRRTELEPYAIVVGNPARIVGDRRTLSSRTLRAVLDTAG